MITIRSRSLSHLNLNIPLDLTYQANESIHPSTISGHSTALCRQL